MIDLPRGYSIQIGETLEEVNLALENGHIIATFTTRDDPRAIERIARRHELKVEAQMRDLEHRLLMRRRS